MAFVFRADAVKGVIDAVTGVDGFTGQKLTWLERMMNLTPGRKASKLADEAAEAAVRAGRAAKSVENSTENVIESVLRREGKEIGSGAAGNVSSPSALAQAFQGKGAYPGVDRFRDITLKKGTIVYAGEPGASGFFTTSSAFSRTGNDATAIFEGLQVASYQGAYRPGITAFVVTRDTAAAFAIARANPQFGAGGLPQIYIPNFNQFTTPTVGYPLSNIILGVSK